MVIPKRHPKTIGQRQDGLSKKAMRKKQMKNPTVMNPLKITSRHLMDQESNLLACLKPIRSG